MQAFGLHLTMDCYNGNAQKLADENEVKRFLNELPDLINMHKISEPFIIYYPSPDKPEDEGISGVILIAESHISIHTFPKKQYASVDIFSCKEFDVPFTINYVLNFFEFSNAETNVFDRGLEFPKNLDMVSKIIDKQRKEV